MEAFFGEGGGRGPVHTPHRAQFDLNLTLILGNVHNAIQHKLL